MLLRNSKLQRDGFTFLLLQSTDTRDSFQKKSSFELVTTEIYIYYNE